MLAKKILSVSLVLFGLNAQTVLASPQKAKQSSRELAARVLPQFDPGTLGGGVASPNDVDCPFTAKDGKYDRTSQQMRAETGIRSGQNHIR